MSTTNEIKTTYRFLTEHDAGLTELGKPTQIPIKDVHRIVKFRKAVREALDIQREVYNKIVEDYGSEDENGNKSLRPNVFGWDAAQKAIRDLDYNTFLTIKEEPFKLSELDAWYGKKNFPNYANIIINLGPFVVDDTTESEKEEIE